jgi:AcrR family transcriptional regulator
MAKTDAGNGRRRTQQERSNETRYRLLDAAVECLLKLGYAKTRTTDICLLAGVSRGALLHHFHSKEEILTLAVQHLGRTRLEELRSQMRSVPEPLGLADSVGFLWSGFSGPLFVVAVEVWNAARTDANLHSTLVPVERTLGQEMMRLDRLLFDGLDLGDISRDDLIELSINLMRGLALTEILREDPARTAELVRVWARILGRACSSVDSESED